MESTKMYILVTNGFVNALVWARIEKLINAKKLNKIYTLDGNKEEKILNWNKTLYGCKDNHNV